MNTSETERYVTEMRLMKLSEVTIGDRLDILHRLRVHLAQSLLDATPDQLLDFQSRFVHLAPASIDIYTRHIQAFYRWAYMRALIGADPSAALVSPRIPRGRPHPTCSDDLRTIFACTIGPLRTAYVLAAFAGLRRGEICRLHRREIETQGGLTTALIHGKGGKERFVPLLTPVIEELALNGSGSGWVITKNGRPYEPEVLSWESSRHLQSLGLRTTLHSMRHTFATTAYRTTHDILLVRDLIGHESVATTQVYAEADTSAAHERLAGVAEQASDVLRVRRLRVVGNAGA